HESLSLKGIHLRAVRNTAPQNVRINLVIQHHQVPPLGGKKNSPRRELRFFISCDPFHAGTAKLRTRRNSPRARCPQACACAVRQTWSRTEFSPRPPARPAKVAASRRNSLRGRNGGAAGRLPRNLIARISRRLPARLRQPKSGRDLAPACTRLERRDGFRAHPRV